MCPVSARAAHQTLAVAVVGRLRPDPGLRDVRAGEADRVGVGQKLSQAHREVLSQAHRKDRVVVCERPRRPGARAAGRDRDHMVMTPWSDILGVIAAMFAGVLALLVLVVYLEAWLARPDPPTPASADAQPPHEPDRGRAAHWAPDLSVQAGASCLPRTRAPGRGLDPPVAPVGGHLFTVSPPNTGHQ